MKEKKNLYRFPCFIRNQWFKDIFRRSKERKAVNEKYVKFSLFYEESKIKGFYGRHLIFGQHVKLYTDK